MGKNLLTAHQYQEVRMPAAGSKGAPKNPAELKDDNSSSRAEKQVLSLLKVFCQLILRNHLHYLSIQCLMAAIYNYDHCELFLSK